MTAGTLSDTLAPVVGLLTMAAGGIVILLSRLREETALRSKRLDLVSAAQNQNYLRRREPQKKAASSPWYASGLSEAEKQQILRSFTGLGVPEARALTLFGVFRLSLIGGALVSSFFLAPAAAPALSMAIASAATVCGWLLPVLLIRRQLKQHVRTAGMALPDALELLAVSIDAGLSLEGGLQRIARELAISQPALADELALTWAEMSLFPDRERALKNLGERLKLPGVRAVIGTLSQSLRLGTPLAQSLRSAAAEMRNEQLIELEERANRLPAMLTIPVMLFIMPAVFLIVGGPAALKLIDMFAKVKLPH